MRKKSGSVHFPLTSATKRTENPRNRYGGRDLRLGTDLEADTSRGVGLGVVDGLRTRLDVGGDAVVVAGGEGAQVPESMDGDGVLWGGVTDGAGVAGDLALGDVVGSLGTDQETVTAENGVSGEGRALSCNETC